MKRVLCILAAVLSLASCEKYYFTGMVAPAGENVDERFRQSMEFNDLHGYQTIRTFSDLYAATFSQTAILRVRQGIWTGS